MLKKIFSNDKQPEEYILLDDDENVSNINNTQNIDNTQSENYGTIPFNFTKRESDGIIVYKLTPHKGVSTYDIIPYFVTSNCKKQKSLKLSYKKNRIIGSGFFLKKNKNPEYVSILPLFWHNTINDVKTKRNVSDNTYIIRIENTKK